MGREVSVYSRDKGGNFRSIRSIKAAKEAGIDDIGEFYMDNYIGGMEDLLKTYNDKELEKNLNDKDDDQFPVGFKPYNDIWRYEPIESRHFFKRFIGFQFTEKQQEAIDVICGVNPFVFTEKKYEEADLMWGKRSGKDTTIAGALCYQGYKLSCLVDPQQFLGMGMGSAIDIVNVASNSRQAKNVFFKYLKTFVKYTKDPETGRNWFATKNFYWDVGKRKFEYMDLRDKDGDIKQDSIDFQRGITCHSLTSDRFTGEGLNVILAVMDEIGAMRADRVFGGMETDKEIGQYDSLSATVRSTSTKNLGKMVVMSYKYGKNCPMSMLIKKNRKDPKKFVRVYSVFEVRTDKPKDELMEQFKSFYDKDAEKAAMIYECKDPLVDTNNLYSNSFIIKNAFDVNHKFAMNPFKKQLCVIDDISNPANEVLEPWFHGEKDKYYTAHLDLAKGQVWRGYDAAAMAMGHIEEMRVSYDELWMKYYKKNYGVDLAEVQGQLRYGIVIDLLVQIICKPENKEIRISDVRRFVIDLYEKRGFNIFKATVDGWQSLETIQELNHRGIETELLSVDKSPVPHQTQKDFIQNGIFKTYYHSIWEREMGELIEDNGKVDHPEFSTTRFEKEGYEFGSKDIADCTAGVCMNLVDEVGGGNDILV